jgi:hypothetical protein
MAHPTQPLSSCRIYAALRNAWAENLRHVPFILSEIFNLGATGRHSLVLNYWGGGSVSVIHVGGL